MVLDITPESVEGMKVQELKDALTSRGLSIKGIKKELAARLLEAISNPTSAEGPPVEEEAPPAPPEAEPEPAAPAGDAPLEPPVPAAEQADEVPPAAEEPMAAAEEAAPAEAAPAEAAPAEAAGVNGEQPVDVPPAEDAGGEAAAPAEGVENAEGAGATVDDGGAVPTVEDEAAREARLVAMREQVGGLRKQHAELTTLVQQWYGSVMQLQQQQQAAAAAAARQAPAYPGYGGYGGGAPGAYPGYPGYGAPHAAAAAPSNAWTEHNTAEGHKYWYNATTGQSSWEQPPGARRGGGGGGGGGGGPKSKGPPGANLFIVRKMRRGEFDEFYDADLREAFERYGSLLRAEITLDKETGVSKGFGFVSFSDAAAADAAMAAMNGAMIGGRQIRIEKTAEDH